MVGPLMNEKGEIEKDPYQMAEILRRQYESAFSTPDAELNIDNVSDFFFNIEKDKEGGEDEREEGEDERKSGEDEREGGDHDERQEQDYEHVS